MKKRYHKPFLATQPSLFDAPPQVTKACTICHEEKPLDAFACNKRGVHGREPRCRECRKVYFAWYHDTKRTNPEIFARQPYVPPDTRVCTRCQKELPLNSDCFKQDKRYKGGYTTWCKQCDSDWHKEHYAKPEIRARFTERQSTEEHKNKVRARYQERMETEPEYRERILKQAREQAKRDAPKWRAKAKQRYATDPAYARKVLDATRAWELAHPEKARNSRFHKHAKRRAARIAARAAGNPVDLKQIIERDGYTCYICEKPIDPTLGHRDPACLSFDHRIPLIPRPGEPKGEDVPENVHPAHNCCNGRKSNKRFEDLTEWERRGPDR